MLRISLNFFITLLVIVGAEDKDDIQDAEDELFRDPNDLISVYDGAFESFQMANWGQITHHYLC